MEESKQHVQVPNNMTEREEINPRDIMIYASIKRYENSKTKEAFPSLDLISEHSGSSKPTIKKSVEKLVKYGYLNVRKEGRKNVYKFNDYKKFEPFSYDFLDKKDLDQGTKSYVLAAQQFMYKDIPGFGKVNYSDNKLGGIMNISHNSVAKYNKILEDKGYLSIIQTDLKDDNGLLIKEKVFNLNELEQAIVFTLQNHENRISNNEDLLEQLSKENEQLKKTQDQMLKQIDILLKTHDLKKKQTEEEQSTIML